MRAAVELRRAALAAGLPAGALARASAFADAAVDERMWLELMRESAEHSPALADADLVAAHPDHTDAPLFAARLVTHAPGAWPRAAVRRRARSLLDAAAALSETERPAALAELRTALVNAGDVDVARRL